VIIRVEFSKREQKLARFFKRQYGESLRQRITKDAWNLLQKTEEMYEAVKEVLDDSDSF